LIEKRRENRASTGTVEHLGVQRRHTTNLNQTAVSTNNWPHIICASTHAASPASVQFHTLVRHRTCREPRTTLPQGHSVSCRVQSQTSSISRWAFPLCAPLSDIPLAPTATTT